MNRSAAATIFVLEQHNGLTCHWCRQAKIGKLDNFARERMLRRISGGVRLGFHFTIEAEAMYLLK